MKCSCLLYSSPPKLWLIRCEKRSCVTRNPLCKAFSVAKFDTGDSATYAIRSPVLLLAKDVIFVGLFVTCRSAPDLDFNEYNWACSPGFSPENKIVSLSSSQIGF